MNIALRYASQATLLLLAGVQTAASQSDCQRVADLKLPDVRIEEARAVGPDSEDDPIQTPYCKVDGVIGTEIRFELLLPDEWNGRFAMGGGGGFVGSVQNAARWTVNEGYATAGTDTGHEGPGTSAAWALNEPERQVNFGHLAVHRTAEVAKAIIRAHYASAPEYSYFMGCSRGGGQALMEAQRYPGDFDGIISGAPAFDWTGISAEMIRNMQKSFPDPSRLDSAIMSRDHLEVLEKSVLAKCDTLDGVRDGVMEDPRRCTFDIGSLPGCPAESNEGLCFTGDQLEAIREIYAPPSNRDGSFYVAQPFGAEGEDWGWVNWVTGVFTDSEEMTGTAVPSLQYAFGIDIAKYFVFNDPDWDYTAYDFATWHDDAAFAGAILNATDPDLRAFANAGNKLILWHGWSDAALSALASIDYFEHVEAGDPNVRDYFRLYLMPGVLHCSGGPGPDQVDWLGALTDWVERDQPPGRVIASKLEEDEVVRTRPLCPYPQTAVYTGSGSTDEAENFECATP